MHVPLDEHLHTPACNEIIRELKRCHEEHSLFRQFFGVCNQLDWAMRDCTKGERLERTSENMAKAKKRQAEVKERLANLKHKDWRDNLKEKLENS